MKRTGRMAALAAAGLLAATAAWPGDTWPAMATETQPDQESGFVVDPDAVAGIYRTLSGRMSAMTAAGRTAYLRVHGHDRVNGHPAVLLAYGEERSGTFLPLEVFAVDEGGTVYTRMNDSEYLSSAEMVRAGRSRDIVFVEIPYATALRVAGRMRAWWPVRDLSLPATLRVLGFLPAALLIAVPPAVG